MWIKLSLKRLEELYKIMNLKKMFGMNKKQEIPEQITDFAEIPEIVENKDHLKVVIEK